MSCLPPNPLDPEAVNLPALFPQRLNPIQNQKLQQQQSSLGQDNPQQRTQQRTRWRARQWPRLPEVTRPSHGLPEYQQQLAQLQQAIPPFSHPQELQLREQMDRQASQLMHVEQHMAQQRQAQVGSSSQTQADNNQQQLEPQQNVQQQHAEVHNTQHHHSSSLYLNNNHHHVHPGHSAFSQSLTQDGPLWYASNDSAHHRNAYNITGPPPHSDLSQPLASTHSTLTPQEAKPDRSRSHRSAFSRNPNHNNNPNHPRPPSPPAVPTNFALTFPPSFYPPNAFPKVTTSTPSAPRLKSPGVFRHHSRLHPCAYADNGPSVTLLPVQPAEIERLHTRLPPVPSTYDKHDSWRLDGLPRSFFESTDTPTATSTITPTPTSADTPPPIGTDTSTSTSTNAISSESGSGTNIITGTSSSSNARIAPQNLPSSLMTHIERLLLYPFWGQSSGLIWSDADQRMCRIQSQVAARHARAPLHLALVKARAVYRREWRGLQRHARSVRDWRARFYAWRDGISSVAAAADEAQVSNQARQGKQKHQGAPGTRDFTVRTEEGIFGDPPTEWVQWEGGKRNKRAKGHRLGNGNGSCGQWQERDQRERAKGWKKRSAAMMFGLLTEECAGGGNGASPQVAEWWVPTLKRGLDCLNMCDETGRKRKKRKKIVGKELGLFKEVGGEEWKVDGEEGLLRREGRLVGLELMEEAVEDHDKDVQLMRRLETERQKEKLTATATVAGEMSPVVEKQQVVAVVEKDSKEDSSDGEETAVPSKSLGITGMTEAAPGLAEVLGVQLSHGPESGMEMARSGEASRATAETGRQATVKARPSRRPKAKPAQPQPLQQQHGPQPDPYAIPIYNVQPRSRSTRAPRGSRKRLPPGSSPLRGPPMNMSEDNHSEVPSPGTITAMSSPATIRASSPVVPVDPQLLAPVLSEVPPREGASGRGEGDGGHAGVAESRDNSRVDPRLMDDETIGRIARLANRHGRAFRGADARQQDDVDDDDDEEEHHEAVMGRGRGRGRGKGKGKGRGRGKGKHPRLQ